MDDLTKHVICLTVKIDKILYNNINLKQFLNKMDKKIRLLYRTLNVPVATAEIAG